VAPGTDDPIDVSVIVVNYNGGALLARCLRSLVEHGTAGLRCELIVVDNGSHDGSLEAARDLAIETLIIDNGQNLGFPVACNQAADRARGSFLLLLNPDAALEAGTLQRLVAFLRDDTEGAYAMVGPRLLADNGATARCAGRLPGPEHFLYRSLGLSQLAPDRFAPFHLHDFDHEHSRDVDHVMASVALVRADAWRALGGMDTRFFLYLEDLDFSLRLKEAGWRSRYLADVTARHVGGGISSQFLARRQAYWAVARLQYARKHFGLVGAGSVAAATLGVEPGVRLLLSAVRRDGGGVLDLVRAQALVGRRLLTGHWDDA
jgi:N-acetylglucosaminyl-diphospho-decaprenol L-rhamnosyltransferase